MSERILLATDLDRTVLPNGAQEESSGARDAFRSFVSRDNVTLAYVSGRGETLLKEAIDSFDIPVPDYAIGDVGTTIFVTGDGSWTPLMEWQEKIAPDWKGKQHADLVSLFDGIDTLTLQEESKQNTFKVSYYAPEDTDRGALLGAMQERLDKEGIQASLIWSIDEPEHTGLLDVLPASATKADALRFLQRYLKMDDEQTVFCGDSGNDLPALTSGTNAVLVANARTEVQEEAATILKEKGLEDRLYIARGGFRDMNGNYSAGVLEGVAHFFPKLV